MSIDFNQLQQFLTAIAQTDITELTLKGENFELAVRRGMAAITAVPGGETAELPVTLVAPPAQKPMAVPTAPAEAPAPTPAEKKWTAITSPVVGTFYSAPAPGEAAFVEVGDRIRVGQTVCIVEAMKVMNEIEAEVSGQVMDLAVENGQPVEYGQTLMWIAPS